MTWATSAVGMPIDREDKHGMPIHVGDMLRFDEKEWGAPCTFVIEVKRGEITHPGCCGDLDQWCEILTKFDGTVVRE